MEQATNTGRVATPWLLIAGLLTAAGLLIFMSVDVAGLFFGTGSNVVQLSEANWQEEVADSKIPVLVDFTAEWCGPCKVFAPTIEKIADRYAGKVKVGTVDIDANPMVSEGYKVTSIPRVIVFADGEPVASFVGLQSEEALAGALDKILAKR